MKKTYKWWVGLALMWAMVLLVMHECQAQNSGIIIGSGGSGTTSEGFAFEYTLDSLTTTDGTPDTIFSFTAYQDTNYIVETYVYGIRTGGTAGNPGDQFNSRLKYVWINVRDTLSSLQADFGVIEDVGGVGTNSYWQAEGTEAKLLVRGVTDYDFSWYSQVLITKVPYNEYAAIGTGGAGGYGSDYQAVDQFEILSDTLWYQLRNDGQAPHFVDLSSYTGGGGGTDDQAITRSNDTIYIEDGGFIVLPDTTHTVDTDTDNQTVDTFSLTGTTLTLAVEDDAESPYTVDLSSFTPDSLGVNHADGEVLVGTGDFTGQTFSNFNVTSNSVMNLVGDIRTGSTTGTVAFRMGHARTSDGSAQFDMFATASPGFGDYGTRMFRASGANGGFNYQNNGTGNINFYTDGNTHLTATFRGSDGSVDIASMFDFSQDGVLEINNTTSAPASSPANLVSLYAEDVSASSELKVRDEAGNITTLSPHNFTLVEPSHEMAWSYYSERDGIAINVDMFRVVQLLEELTGEKLIHIKAVK